MPYLVSIVDRISIGKINLGRYGRFLYVGRESTLVYKDVERYGGTILGLFRSTDVKTRKIVTDKLDVAPELVAMGLETIQKYEQIALDVGRVSVDVIEGITDNGSRLRSVIDITPRVGGATPAEVLAVRAISGSCCCFASSRLIYDPLASPKTGTSFIDTPSLVINANVSEVI